MSLLKKVLITTMALTLTASLFTGCSGTPQGTQFEEPVKGQQVATMKIKDFGEIKIALFSKQAPKAVENFATHAKDGYFDGLTFHRVIADFMIQGGDPNGNGTGGESIWDDPFEDEFSPLLRNFTGAISMANSGPDSNGSQFFIVDSPPIDDASLEYINTTFRSSQDHASIDNYTKKDKAKYAEIGGAPHLDEVHTVFGQVYEGLDIIKKIMAVEKDASDMPVVPVVIETVTISVAA